MPLLHCVRDAVVRDKARTGLPGTQKARTFGKRCWVKLEGINGIRNQGLKEPLCLRKESTSGRIFRKTIELGIMN
jgi:hypothetical protein